jgi:hypothetical protein
MSTNTHLIAPEEVMALLDGELSVDRAQSVSAHLEECARCRQLSDSLHSDSQTLSAWTVPIAPANPQFETRLSETAFDASSRERFPAGPNFRMLHRRWRLLAPSAALVILFGWLAVAFLRPHYDLYSPRVTSARTVAESAEHPPSLGKLQSSVDNARADETARANGTIGRLIGGVAADSNRSYRGWLTPAGKPLAVLEQRGIASPEDRFTRHDAAQAPMIARTVSLSMLVKDFEKSRASLDAVVARHHGYAAGLTASTQQNSARSLQASLRIPAAELSAVATELKSLGRVENETQNGEEVTQQHADLVARLKNSRETEQRLQAILLQRTGKISDVLAVEQEIARVRGEIEQMEVEQKSLEHRVDFATVDLRLAEEYKAQLNSPSPSISTRLHNALVAGYRAAVETVVGIILFFAEVGPSLLVWLIVLFPIAWLFWRRWRRGYAIGASFSA